jgi:saccharopine dehydrogenase-like NADP-dependent oxidoreductase
MGERIAVVGATGYTGGLMVAELARRGVEVLAIGRNATKLAALPPAVDWRAVDGSDVDVLADALDGCRAVVSCVGSFAECGDTVVAAAIAAGASYVDTSAEFPFLQRVFDVHDGPARAAGVALVPGTAFYAAPADLAAALAARALGCPPDTIDVFYRLLGARPSRGTLRTNLRRLGEPCPVREGGGLAWRRIGDDRREVGFPAPHGGRTVARWPGAEILTVPRHAGAPSVGVYLGMPKVAAAVFRTPALTGPLVRLGRRVAGGATTGPSEAARRRARFVILVSSKDSTSTA